MNVAIATDCPEDESIEVMREELLQAGHQVSIWSEISDVDPNTDGFICYGYEFSPIADPMDRAARYGRWLGIPCTNGYFPQLARDKVAAHFLGDRFSIPQPQWQLAKPGCRQEFQADYYVAKPCRGSCADGVERFASWEDALKYCLSQDKNEYFIQQFVAGDVVRVLASPEEVLISYCKEPPSGEWIAAVSTGSARIDFPLSPEQQQLAISIVKQLGYDYLGLDLIINHEETLFLEGNITPALPRTVVSAIRPGALAETITRSFHRTPTGG